MAPEIITFVRITSEMDLKEFVKKGSLVSKITIFGTTVANAEYKQIVFLHFCLFFRVPMLGVSDLQAASWSGERGRKICLRMWWSSPLCRRLTKSKSILENCLIWNLRTILQVSSSDWSGYSLQPAGETKRIQPA